MADDAKNWFQARFANLRSLLRLHGSAKRLGAICPTGCRGVSPRGSEGGLRSTAILRAMDPPSRRFAKGYSVGTRRTGSGFVAAGLRDRGAGAAPVRVCSRQVRTTNERHRYLLLLVSHPVVGNGADMAVEERRKPEL